MDEVPRDILIVEDNPVTRRVLHATLKKAGFPAREAEDGKTALQEIRRARPALVLLDLVLPDTHGLHLIARIREEVGGDLPVVACSGGIGGLTVEQLNRAGFSGLLEKPVEPARLLRLLQSHLPENPHPALQGQGRRLLLVDHDETQRLALEKRLAQHRFEIVTASSFREALERLRQEDFFAVLVEMQLPEQDGFDLVVAIRNLRGQAHLPVLLLSEATPEQGVRELALQLGATDLLSRTPARREVEEALARLAPSPDRLSFPAIEAPSRSDRDLGRLLVKLENQLTLNASLSRQNLRLTAQLDILATLARSLVRQEELPDVLGEILEIIVDTEGFALGGVEAPGALVSPELCAVGDGLERLRGLLARVREEAPPPSEEGRLLTRSVHGGLGVWAELDRPSVQSLFFVPLKGRNGEDGMLLVASESDLERRPEGIQFVRGVAAQIEQALALRQAILDERRLLEQATRQRKEALEQAKQLRAILASWKALVESVPDLILHLDLSGVILFSNQAAWGMSQQELVGKRLELLLPGESREPWSRQFSEVVRGSEGRSGEVVFELHPEEGKRWGAFHLGAIREGEEVAGVIVDLRDITQKKRSDEQALFADRMASVGMMAAGVAHEINNPLTAISTNLELSRASLGDLSDPARVQELREMLEDASQAAERVRLIVRDLKVFSRSEEEQMGPVDLQKVLDTSVRVAWNEIRHRAHLRRDYHPVPPIQGHESRLGQAFLNLLLNAVQAIPAVGHAEENEILVGLREESGGVRVTIQDTGEGIAPEVMQHLFTPFFTTKPIGEGTGLGLSVCRQIIEKHRGEFSIESTPGQGTRVSILLPLTRSVRAAGAPPAPVALSGGRILVVDDEPVITTVVRRILGSRYAVETCQEAPEALARIDRGDAFDLILCDLMMPRMSGMDFHEELSRRHPEVASRVFFLTGGAFTTKTRAFLDTVPGRYLEKPFQSADLLRFVADRICLALQRIPEGLPWYPSKTENTPPNSPLRIPEMKQQPGALNEPPHLLAVVGRGGNRERLKRLAHLASAEVREVASADELLRLALSPAAVLLPLETPAEEWAALRASPDHGTTPLLGLTDEATELAFAETFARGGEDLLLLQDPDDALARLRAIPAAMAAPRTRARCALIVSERAGWRGEMARRLRVAGVEVRFAGADQEALDFAAQPSVSVVVLDATARLEGAVALVETLRRQGIQVPVLLAVQPGDLGRGSAALQGQTAVAVHDALGLAEALLFVVNEMTAGAVRERRQSPRVLFGTCVWVRPAGGERDRIGYSYTVSEGGLFVRTVDPSPVGARLWVETNPPRVGRRVRLVATVAWARGVGPLGEAISPPGMGLRIDGGLPGDWEVYREGCQALFALHRPPGQQG